MDAMSTARDFSVMPVQVDGEATPIERAVRPKGRSLQAGSYVDVEFGATFATVGDRHERIDGQWRQCLVLRHEGAIVHARLSPSPTAEQPPPLRCHCDEGLGLRRSP